MKSNFGSVSKTSFFLFFTHNWQPGDPAPSSVNRNFKEKSISDGKKRESERQSNMLIIQRDTRGHRKWHTSFFLSNFSWLNGMLTASVEAKGWHGRDVESRPIAATATAPNSSQRQTTCVAEAAEGLFLRRQNKSLILLECRQRVQRGASFRGPK